MFRLSDEHLEKAKEIAISNRKKKKCNYCYDRGYIGVTEENLLVPCHKCVDIDKTMEQWKIYVKSVPELLEQFPELFEEENKDQDTEKSNE